MIRKFCAKIFILKNNIKSLTFFLKYAILITYINYYIFAHYQANPRK